jgi:hypothetical protein
MKGSDTARLYTITIALLIFFLVWAGIAAHPWTGPEPVTRADPRTATLAAREAHLVNRTRVARRVLIDRWTRYQHRLAARIAAIERAAGRRAGDAPRAAAPPPVVVWAGRSAPLAWTGSS